MTNVMRREQIAFATRTADALVALGARQIDPPYGNGPDSLVISMGRFEIDTRAGRLAVTAYGDSIMTRFDDARTAAEMVGASFPSGKWNFHKFNVGVEHDQADTEGLVLALFLQNVTPILCATPEAWPKR